MQQIIESIARHKLEDAKEALDKAGKIAKFIFNTAENITNKPWTTVNILFIIIITMLIGVILHAYFYNRP